MSNVRNIWTGSPEGKTIPSDRREGESEYIAMLSPETRESYREFMARRHDPDKDFTEAK